MTSQRLSLIYLQMVGILVRGSVATSSFKLRLPLGRFMCSQGPFRNGDKLSERVMDFVIDR